jgi:TonB-dependent receptor
LADVETTDETKEDFLAGSKYAAGRFFSGSFLGRQNFNDASLFDKTAVESEFLPANFDVKEKVYAGYVMANQEITDNFSVLFGLRLENTQISTLGNEVLFNEDGDFTGVNPIADDNSYTNVLPGVHLKYNIDPNSIIRFAWTNTIARPNYSDLVPFRNVIAEDEEIETGNAELDPTTSMNFDVMAEHYFKSVGVVSAGVFYKDIQDFVYQSRSKDVSGGATDGYDIFKPLNGDNATILGAEFAFQRQLDFLPGFAENLSVYLNYTLLTSSTDGVRSGDDIRTDVDLPGTTPNMFNASLAYSDNKFNVRMSLNFSDSYIDELGDDEFTDRYYDKQLFLDMNANYNINQRLQIYASLNNITNQPLRYYQGVSSRTQQIEFYEKRITIGLKYDLFKK